MKTDLTTSILAAVIGVIIAFFVCNMFIPGIEDFTIKTLGTNLTYSLAEPNSEIFNYRAVNPTVEVYVGQCKEYDANGNCVEQVKALNENDTENTEKDETNNTNKTDTETENKTNDETTNQTDNTDNTDNSTNPKTPAANDTTPEPVTIPEETR